MNQAEFRKLRDQRHAARAAFEARLMAVKADYAKRGIGGRVTDRVTIEAMDALYEGLETAKDQKAVIGLSTAVLILWFIRKPVIAGIYHILNRQD